MFLGLTGMPMRKIALANMPLALAEPVPLTLANLMTKSLMASLGCIINLPWSLSRESAACPRPR